MKSIDVNTELKKIRKGHLWLPVKSDFYKRLFIKYGKDWQKISEIIGDRSSMQCFSHAHTLASKMKTKK